ncbi:MAG TPA: hypothetical protein VGB93_01070 [Methylovirgula sp.]
MNDYRKIELQRLKAVVCRLMHELARQTGSDTFPLPDEDFYWKIPFEEQIIENGQTKPSDFHVGRLRDDWELTQGIADYPIDQILSPYSLTEVAPLLEYMGNSVTKSS